MDSPRSSRPLQSIGLAPPTEKYTGALVVAASLIAAIRLRGEELRPSPRVSSVIADSVALAKTILREVMKQ